MNQTPVTPKLLHEVAQENRRINQIGDNIEDGLGWDVGEGLGLTRPEDAYKLPISPEAAGRVGSAVAGSSVELEQVSDADTTSRKKLTIAEMNANERRHIAETRRRYPKNRLGR
jgi:hypothetical protein